MKIGVISDTHNTFDKLLEDFLSPCDEIWHAGDIGSLELADKIAAFKPLRAVYGNIDGGVMRRMFNDVNLFEVEGVKVLMTHIGGYPRHYSPKALQHIHASQPKLFIAGHSHILKVIYDPVYDLLHINPGGAGKYGVHAVRTAVRFDNVDGDIRHLEIGEWPK
jgi:putative phosphoesterase